MIYGNYFRYTMSTIWTPLFWNHVKINLLLYIYTIIKIWYNLAVKGNLKIPDLERNWPITGIGQVFNSP